MWKDSWPGTARLEASYVAMMSLKSGISIVVAGGSDDSRDTGVGSPEPKSLVDDTAIEGDGDDDSDDDGSSRFVNVWKMLR